MNPIAKNSTTPPIKKAPFF